jgi:hypothetical protein
MRIILLRKPEATLEVRDEAMIDEVVFLLMEAPQFDIKDPCTA